MKAKAICILSAVFCLMVLPCVQGVTITFEDGVTNISRPGGVGIFNHYSDLGVLMPNLRFHLSTYSGNVPFNFTDDWGAVIDAGVLGTITGYVEFANPVDYVEIEGMAQGEFGLNGDEPFWWNVSAYDTANNLVDFEEEWFGFDFAGDPNPPNVDPYPLANIFISKLGHFGSYLQWATWACNNFPSSV